MIVKGILPLLFSSSWRRLRLAPSAFYLWKCWRPFSRCCLQEPIKPPVLHRSSRSDVTRAVFCLQSKKMFLHSQKRPVPSDHPESQTPKKQRLLDQNMPLQSPSNGHLSSSMGRSSSALGNTSVQSKTEFGRGTNNAQQSPNALYQRHKLCESNSVPKQERSEPAQQSPPSPKHPQIRTETEICTDQQLANGQHKKKKSKKHKEKERERLKPEWVETSPDLKQNQENINGEWIVTLQSMITDVTTSYYKVKPVLLISNVTRR